MMLIVVYGVFYMACESVSLSIMRNQLTEEPSFVEANRLDHKVKPSRFLRFPFEFNGFVIRVSENGELLGDQQEITIDMEDLNNILEKPKRSIFNLNGQSYRILKQAVNNEIVLVFNSRALEIHYLNQLRLVMIGMVVISIVVITLFNSIISKWFTKPAYESWKKQKQFISEASHELKTPVTIISTNVDLLQMDNPPLNDEQQQYLEIIKSESHRMAHMSRELLNLAKLESQPIQYASVDFSQVLTTAVLSFEAIAFESEKSLKFTIEPQCFVKGSKEHLSRLCYLLIDNAVKYCDPKGHIDVKLKRKRNDYHFTVKNDYSNEPLDTQFIFQHFHRESQHRSKEGFGLGLAFVQEICNQYGYKVQVKSLEQSVIFEIILKKANH